MKKVIAFALMFAFIFTLCSINTFAVGTTMDDIVYHIPKEANVPFGQNAEWENALVLEFNKDTYSYFIKVSTVNSPYIATDNIENSNITYSLLHDGSYLYMKISPSDNLSITRSFIEDSLWYLSFTNSAGESFAPCFSIKQSAYEIKTLVNSIGEVYSDPKTSTIELKMSISELTSRNMLTDSAFLMSISSEVMSLYFFCNFSWHGGHNENSSNITYFKFVLDGENSPVAPTLNGEPSTWAKEEILKALEADLVPAHVNSNYTTDITRSDFCDLIIKMIEKKSGKAIADVIADYADAKAEVSFPDTDSANVIAAAKLGIVNGRSSGAFDPTANITRQEAAKMLALAAKVLGADITASEVAFADADDIYAWAKEFIYYVNTIGVMNGTSTTTPPNFSPLRTYTREQSILTVYRLFNAI